MSSYLTGLCDIGREHWFVPGMRQIDALTSLGSFLSLEKTLNETKTHAAFHLSAQIPVFRGASKPIMGKSIDAGYFHGQDGLGDAPDPNAPSLDIIQKEHAVNAILRIVNENPGQVGGFYSILLLLLLLYYYLLFYYNLYSSGISGCYCPTDQPRSCCEIGSVATKQTSWAVHHGRQH